MKTKLMMLLCLSSSVLSLHAQSAGSYWDFLINEDSSSDFWNVVYGDLGPGPCYPTLGERTRITITGPTGGYAGNFVDGFAPDFVRSDAFLGLGEGDFTVQTTSIVYQSGCGELDQKLLYSIVDIPISIAISTAYWKDGAPVVAGCEYASLACLGASVPSCMTGTTVTLNGSCSAFTKAQTLKATYGGVSGCFPVGVSQPWPGPGICN
jgi:hypothetical protein